MGRRAPVRCEVADIRPVRLPCDRTSARSSRLLSCTASAQALDRRNWSIHECFDEFPASFCADNSIRASRLRQHDSLLGIKEVPEAVCAPCLRRFDTIWKYSAWQNICIADIFIGKSLAVEGNEFATSRHILTNPICHGVGASISTLTGFAGRNALHSHGVTFPILW